MKCLVSAKFYGTLDSFFPLRCFPESVYHYRIPRFSIDDENNRRALLTERTFTMINSFEIVLQQRDRAQCL